MGANYVNFFLGSVVGIIAVFFFFIAWMFTRNKTVSQYTDKLIANNRECEDDDSFRNIKPEKLIPREILDQKVTKENYEQIIDKIMEIAGKIKTPNIDSCKLSSEEVERMFLGFLVEAIYDEFEIC